MDGILYTDGGSRSNPGHAGTASLLFNDKNELIDFFSKAYEVLTNNQAEYYALLDGLTIAQKNNIKKLSCFLDSELIVKQIKGEYKVKDENIKNIYLKIINLINQFESVTVQHIPREKNKLADKLVNLTLDAYERI